MLILRAIGRIAVSVLLIGGVASCSIPGIRPEGRTATISANAPASRADVYTRAKTWFARNQYTIDHDVASAQLRGHSTIATEGGVETRAVVEFVITSATMNPAGIAVAPARMSSGSLSKSTSSPSAVCAPEATVTPPAVTRALKTPFRGERSLPSTEIFERAGRRCTPREFQ